MTAGLKASIANGLLDSLGNNTAAPAQTAFYAKLHIGDPGAAGSTSAAVETTRQSVSFGAASAGSMANDALVTWTAVSTTETVTHVSYWDHISAGAFIGSCALASSKALTAGDDAKFAIGALTLAITPIAA